MHVTTYVEHSTYIHNSNNSDNNHNDNSNSNNSGDSIQHSRIHNNGNITIDNNIFGLIYPYFHTINRQTWRTYVRDGECTSGLYRPCDFLFLLYGPVFRGPTYPLA